MTFDLEPNEFDPFEVRRLDEEETTDKNNTTANGSSSIILNTLRVYGTFYAVVIILFEILRRRFPRLYSIRSWIPEQECQLAKEKYPGLFSWFWLVFKVSDEQIFDQCGMDALCFIRAMRFCRHLSILGTLNALWLLPVYKTAKSAPETANVTDGFDTFTIANLPHASVRFSATVLAAYIMFLSTMYLLSKEFKWYTKWRHKFLRRRVPRNYTVYVFGIPKEYRASHKLAEYFRDCSSDAAVLEAHVTMETPHLEKLQLEREKAIQRLEHIHGLKKRRGKRRSSRTGLAWISPEIDDVVQTLEQRVRELNTEIPRRIQEVQAVNDRFRSRFMRFQSTRDLLGKIDMEEGSEGNEMPHFLENPTIDENATMDFDDTPTDFRASFVRDGTAATMQLTTGENESESPSASDIPNNVDNNAAGEERARTAIPDKIGELEQHSNDPLMSASNPDVGVFDNGDRAFLSIFLPDAEGLLPSFGFKKNVPPNRTTTEESSIESGSIEETMRGLDVGTAGGEVPSTVSLVDTPEIDLEAQSPEFDMSRLGDEPESDGEVTMGDISGHLGGATRAAPPGVGSRQNSASTSSLNSRGAMFAVTNAGRSIARGTSAAKYGIAKRSKSAGKQLKKGSKFTKDTLSKGGKLAGKTFDTATTKVLKAAKDIKVDRLVHHAGNFVPIVLHRGEGEARSGGFVTFTTLYAAQAALQMLHNETPYTMEVQEAPSPGDVFWRNVGMKPKKRRLGRLYSITASAFLCFFWSIPTAFIASLTSVSSIKQELPELGAFIEENPWFEDVLFQLAPMLLLFLNEVFLPGFLKVFATWEGHVSSAIVEGSLFLKLSAFMIIQTFFVSAISGSILNELTDMLRNPQEVVSLLSTSLPSQSSYFVQIMFAATFLIQGVELLRLYPLGCALLRRFVGPNATKKERRKTWLYIYTLEEPPEFWHAETFAQIQILYVMVLLVYAVIAPFTACALLFCFLLLEAGYRYQFIHNYPIAFDTGGKLWFTFVQFVLASLLISEITLAGLLTLKQSKYAGPAIGPLIVITVMFIMYINSRHSHVMKFLPTKDCIRKDKEHAKQGSTDYTFCKGEYLQPSLKKYREDPHYEDFEDE